MDFPNFTSPPVVELVLGVQFAPLPNLTTGHYGLFWQSLGDEWTGPADAIPIEDQFELFDPAPWPNPGAFSFRLQPVRPPGRFTLEHRDQQRMLQLQQSRFHLNWRKRDSFYPSYRSLISQFEDTYSRFTDFADRSGVGKLTPNQWELTYVDAFPQGEYWNTLDDWSSFLPGLFGTLRPAGGLALERRSAEWSFEIVPRQGRLHVTAQTGRTSDGDRQSLLLQMTARGPIGRGGVESLREGLDVGHGVAVETFLRVTSDEIKARWGQKS